MIASGAGITIGAPWIGFSDIKVFALTGIVAGCWTVGFQVGVP